MDTIRAAGLAACALGISFYSDAHAATETDGGLLTSVAPPPNSRPLDRQSLPTGGEQAIYMTSTTPAGIISFYMQILPAGGWEVTDSDEEFRRGQPSGYQWHEVPGAECRRPDGHDLC